MFYLLLTILDKEKVNDSVDFERIHENILLPFLRILSKLCEKFYVNIIFSCPNYSILTRFIYSPANKSESPALSLYISSNKADGFIISSEPITNSHRLIPEQTAIYVDHNKKQAFLQSIVLDI